MKLLHLPKHLTKLTLVAAGVVFLGAVFSYGAVLQEQYVTAQKQAVARAEAARNAVESKRQAEWKQSVAELTAANAKLDSVCNSYKTVAAKYRLPAHPFCN